MSKKAFEQIKAGLDEALDVVRAATDEQPIYEQPATDEQIEKWTASAKCRTGGPFAIRDGQMLSLIARIRAERENTIRECADVCRQQQSIFLSPDYATGQPYSSFGERFACSECEREILALSKRNQS